jgi:uncharacterized membrane protein
MGVGVVLTKRWGRPVSLLTMTGWQLTAGGLLLLPTALLAEGLPPTVSTENVAGYAYLSLVGGALAYWLWFRGVERLPAASVSLLGLLSPLVAAVVGWAVLGQRLSPLQLVGMAVALGGVAAGQTAPPSRAAGTQVDPAGHVGAVVPQRRTPQCAPAWVSGQCGHPSGLGRAAVERPAGRAGPPVTPSRPAAAVRRSPSHPFTTTMEVVMSTSSSTVPAVTRAPRRLSASIRRRGTSRSGSTRRSCVERRSGC